MLRHNIADDEPFSEERSDRGLCPRDWSIRYCTYRRERPSNLDLLSEIGLISEGMVGFYISFERLSQCTWVLKVSVLETGHTRYCSTSGSDPLRQSSSLMSTVVKPQQPPPLFRIWRKFDGSIGKWSWSLSLRLVNPVLQYRRERPSLLDLLSEIRLLADGWLGSISPLGDWANALECWRSPSLRLALKVSVLETGHTRYCSTSGSDPLQQSSSLTWHCR